MFNYNVKNWYWIVDGSDTQVYSSARTEYVFVTDAAYTAWLKAGSLPTKITQNDMLLLQIESLESSITPRRVREAVLGIDSGWLKSANDKIAALRGKL